MWKVKSFCNESSYLFLAPDLARFEGTFHYQIKVRGFPDRVTQLLPPKPVFFVKDFCRHGKQV